MKFKVTEYLISRLLNYNILIYFSIFLFLSPSYPFMISLLNQQQNVICILKHLYIYYNFKDSYFFLKKVRSASSCDHFIHVHQLNRCVRKDLGYIWSIQKPEHYSGTVLSFKDTSPKLNLYWKRIWSKTVCISTSVAVTENTKLKPEFHK